MSYASGGHPPALLFDGSNSVDSIATLLKTPNHIIGGMPDVTYEKKKHIAGKQSKLYVFSDGVYEVEKSDGSMWRFNDFANFMHKNWTIGQSSLNRLYQYALKLGNIDKFEDDFTIIEITFT